MSMFVARDLRSVRLPSGYVNGTVRISFSAEHPKGSDSHEDGTPCTLLTRELYEDIARQLAVKSLQEFNGLFHVMLARFSAIDDYARDVGWRA